MIFLRTFLLLLLLMTSAYATRPARQSFAAESGVMSMTQWCEDVRGAAERLKWKIDPCSKLDWKVGGYSVQGRPLVYADFGDARAKNVTLIFSMVHGDEITPLYLGLELARLLDEQMNKMIDARVIVAPLVNPDGFFHLPKPTRVNAHGIDINRNFSTKDWQSNANRLWKVKYRSDPRRFPGKISSSEPETRFQEEMIRLFMPHKVLSIHSPLNFLDYDGPGTIQMPELPSLYVKECEKLKHRLKAVSGGFFPGSLGNYAGHRGIPTITAELRSTDPRKAEQYWNQVRRWIETLIQFSVSQYAVVPNLDMGG
jgi:murein peptide amidase A